MIYLPDFKEKSILFIKAGDFNESKIRFSNDNIVFLKDEKVENRISCHKVFVVFIVGELSITSVLIKKCLQYGVSLFLLDKSFKVYGSFGAKAEGNYLLRMKQYAFDKELLFSKHIIKNKIFNQLRLLRKRRILQKEEYHNQKKEIFQKIDSAKDNQELLGIEGSQQKNFYGLYFKELSWYKRMPRTKVDETNLLLDIGYTFLFNYCDSLLRLYGFDTYKGFYHKLFFQRKSLSCDIMEPFRCVIDHCLLKSFRLKQIDKKDFKITKGRYFLDFQKSQKYAEIFLAAISEYKEEIFKFIYGFYRTILTDSDKLPVFKV